MMMSEKKKMMVKEKREVSEFLNGVSDCAVCSTMLNAKLKTSVA